MEPKIPYTTTPSYRRAFFVITNKNKKIMSMAGTGIMLFKWKGGGGWYDGLRVRLGDEAWMWKIPPIQVVLKNILKLIVP